ncbi:MAG: MFS transporter [Chlamydiales bacterium]
MRYLTSPFACLNYAQFLAAINENLYKLLTAFFLIEYMGEEHTNMIMSVIGALFILPFLLFSSVGGILADRWPKNRIIYVTRICELGTMLMAFFIFGLPLTYGAYILLFVMSSLAAIFGPAKYGAIPELLDKKKILFGNSVIAAFTYLGIILGTALASFAVWATHSNFVLCILFTVLFAAIGTLISFFIPKTPVKNSTKRFRLFVYAELWDALKQMWTIPSMIGATFAFSYFLFIGGFLQLNLIPYAIQDLRLTDIYGGYFFLVVALGLGLGAFLTNKISKGKILLSMVPFSGVGISCVLFLMKWVYTPWWLILAWMFILGVFGGMFLVPPQAYIIAASPEKDRGRNFATANFFSFVFAFLAAIALYILNVLLKLTPSNSLFIIAIMNLVIMVILTWRTKWLTGRLKQDNQKT